MEVNELEFGRFINNKLTDGMMYKLNGFKLLVDLEEVFVIKPGRQTVFPRTCMASSKVAVYGPLVPSYSSVLSPLV